MGISAEKLISNLSPDELVELVEAIKRACPSLVSQSFFTRLQVDKAYARGVATGRQLERQDLIQKLAIDVPTPDVASTTAEPAPQAPATLLQSTETRAREAIAMALARGLRVSPEGNYSRSSSALCIIGCIMMREGITSLSREIWAEKLGLTHQQAIALEAGFCKWGQRSYEDKSVRTFQIKQYRDPAPEYYDLGIKLREEFKEKLS